MGVTPLNILVDSSWCFSGAIVDWSWLKWHISELSWTMVHKYAQLFADETHTHPFNDHFSGTTRVSRYQKGNTNLDFSEARDSELQCHQLGCMQVCTSHQRHDHATTQFFTGWMPFLSPNQQRQSTEGTEAGICRLQSYINFSAWHITCTHNRQHHMSYVYAW